MVFCSAFVCLLLFALSICTSVSECVQRIISFLPVGIEILSVQGQGERIIRGVTEFCGYSSEALSKPKNNGFRKMNPEAVVVGGVDFIVISDIHLQYVDNLHKLSIAYVIVSQNSVKDARASIMEIGRRFKVDAEAARITNAMVKKISRISSALSCFSMRYILFRVSHDTGGRGILHRFVPHAKKLSMRSYNAC